MNIRNNLYIMLSIWFLCFSICNHLSFGTDAISGSQSLSGDQTIVSSEGNFELGFFQPGKSSNFYIGMWYKKVAVQTIVWAANRDTPISDKYSSELRILNRNLVLLNESQITVWSTTNSGNSNSTVALLRDDGNFVLKDESSSTQPFWQSFDYPTHTWLPGSKLGYNNRTYKNQLLTSWKSPEDPAPGLFSLELDPDSNEFHIQWRRSESYWTSTRMVPDMALNYINNYSHVSNENENYFTYSLYNPSILSRLIMDVSGQLQQLSWLDSIGEWNLVAAQPIQQCDVYAYCGAFGTCNENVRPPCNCLPGFVPTYGKDRDLGDFSGGCERKTSLQCGGNNSTANGKKDVFLKTFLGMPQQTAAPSVKSLVECESICFNQCECSAYAYGFNGCLLWHRELLSVKQFSEDNATGQTVYIRLAASELSHAKSNTNKRIGVITGSVAGSVTVMGLIIFWRWKNKQGGRNKRFKNRFVLPKRITNLLNDDITTLLNDDITTQGGSSDVPFFSLETIMAATDGFCAANKLGEGGFGLVYKGNLANGEKIAVKRLSSNSGQGIREFKNEVILISKLQHRNLVKLLGFCVEGDEKLLIYEYMPNKSLDAFLSGSSESGILDWDHRYNIIEGIARGLLYLHRDSRLRVIHRDLKPSNILLDEEMNPKIADFGIAKMFGGNQTLAKTNRIVGTYGYMSPEYAMQGLFSEKSDVFSFGVLLLEIVSSKKNSSFFHHEKHLNLLGYVWQLWNEGKALALLDSRLANSKSPSQVLRCIHMGLLCVQEQAKDRPTMSTIVSMLCNEATLQTPKQPAFILEKSSMESDSPMPNNLACSKNSVSVTTLEGR